MQRRQLLRSASAAVLGITALAGCGAPSPGVEDSPTEVEESPAEGASPTETPAETPTETPGATPEETPTETATETPTQTPGETPTGTASPAGQQAQIATHYRFGGRVEAWLGREPQRIADTQNPTITLTAGSDYKVTWENLDGQPHDFTIQDSEGNVIEQTETMSEEGATRTLTFTATEQMAQYVCTVHPTTMVGDIEITSG